MITKQTFVSVIENMRIQHYEDKKNAQLAGEIFQSEHFNLYDNSKLYKSVFDLLREWFPKDSDGHCEIEHFSFCCDFGKIGEIENADQLYDILTKQ